MPDTTPHAPRTWKLALAYDGTDYSGWQVQPNRPTVQQELASALHHVTSETILPQGSGRTDAGVHAMAQVVSFELRANIPPENLLRALNRSLPPAIRVLNAEVAPDGFHARHDALRKTYEYRIYRGEICPPFVARYVFPLNWPLNIDAMHYAAPQILGEHDFLSFAAVDPDLTHREPDAAPPSTVRTILHSAWTEHDAILTYRVTGTGFLSPHGPQPRRHLPRHRTRTSTARFHPRGPRR